MNDAANAFKTAGRKDVYLVRNGVEIYAETALADGSILSGIYHFGVSAMSSSFKGNGDEAPRALSTLPAATVKQVHDRLIALGGKPLAALETYTGQAAPSGDLRISGK